MLMGKWSKMGVGKTPAVAGSPEIGRYRGVCGRFRVRIQ